MHVLPPQPCDVGFVFALAIESGGLVDRLTGATTLRGHGFTTRMGRCENRSVVLVECGAGRPAAAQATEALVDAHRPALVCSAGFAGALQDGLPRGQIIVADRVVDPTGEQWIAEPGELPAWLAEANVRRGTLLTMNRVIAAPEEKRALGQQYAALAVDMETLAAAQACQRRQVPFMAVRVINDDVDERLPADVERLLMQKTAAARLGTAVGSILKRPARVADLLRLQGRALAASEQLAAFLVRVVAHR
jgi:adenosylhomocysteine nucleosidase